MIIREVWAHNLEKEMALIGHIVEKYNFVGMDTEFPGVVARPVGSFKSSAEYHYQTLRWNVDMLKIIQLGVSFSDSNGNAPEEGPCWQFNFSFNLKQDMYAKDSIDLLTRSGINFDKHERNGIDRQEFGELLMSSGLVLNEEVCWISYHSSYDFGYLLKILTCKDLPADYSEFGELLGLYFPQMYDMKFIGITLSQPVHGGLNKLAEFYKVKRHGQVHQAGSDSLLTLQVFLQMLEVTLLGKLNPDHCGRLYGLGPEAGDESLRESDRRLSSPMNHLPNSRLTANQSPEADKAPVG